MLPLTLRLHLLVWHLVHLLHLHLVETPCSSKPASPHLVEVGFAGLHVDVGLPLSCLRILESGTF
jgi:hypothetical protein